MMLKLGDTLEIAKEEQITLIINGVSHHIMCTPEHIDELVLGFLVSEGFAPDPSEIEIANAQCLKNSKIIMVKVKKDVPAITLRSSGCIGVFREKEELPKIIAEEKFSLSEVLKSLKYLDAEEYKRTRGYHIAALVGKEGLIARSYDVGRHNAVDKVIGMGLKRGINLRKTFLTISGRISRGIALKCVRAGIPLVVSKAAILDSAIDVCKKTGLSAVSFATNIALKGDALVTCRKQSPLL